MDDLQSDELIVLVLDGTAEVQTGISATQQDNTPFKSRCQRCLPVKTKTMTLTESLFSGAERAPLSYY